MKLLLSRDQSSGSLFSLVPLRIGSGVIFKLQAELELDEEEAQLIKQYKLESAPIVVSNIFDDIKMAMRPAFLLAVLALFVFTGMGGFAIGAIFFSLVFLGMTGVYFHTMREQILVRTLLDGGKTFRCDSVVELIQKEAYLESVCQYLRQLLESAKHWGDRETIDIKPLDRAEAKQAVLKAFHG